jgi:DNA-binding MarR family transcriptional regulator
MSRVSLAEYRALAEVRYRIRCFLEFSSERARSIGLEPQQHQLLLAIRGLPAGTAPTIGQLAERLQIQHHSAVELVRRTVERGLVAKRASERDRREVLLELTDEGLEVLERLAVVHRKELLSTAPTLVAALTAAVDSSGRGGRE